MKLILLATMVLLTACVATMPSAPTRPMDEVPAQQLLSGGSREYRFANGCVIVLLPKEAVVETEGAICELYQRDIALLYSSAD